VPQAVSNLLEGAAAAKEHGMSVPNPSSAQRIKQEIETEKHRWLMPLHSLPCTLHMQDLEPANVSGTNISATATRKLF
jgi:hypothetical protein